MANQVVRDELNRFTVPKHFEWNRSERELPHVVALRQATAAQVPLYSFVPRDMFSDISERGTEVRSHVFRIAVA